MGKIRNNVNKNSYIYRLKNHALKNGLELYKMHDIKIPIKTLGSSNGGLDWRG